MPPEVTDGLILRVRRSGRDFSVERMNRLPGLRFPRRPWVTPSGIEPTLFKIEALAGNRVLYTEYGPDPTGLTAEAPTAEPGELRPVEPSQVDFFDILIPYFPEVDAVRIVSPAFNRRFHPGLPLMSDTIPPMTIRSDQIR